MYYYTAYGLNIHSIIPLPELIQITHKQPDLVIKEGKINRPISRVDQWGYSVHLDTEEAFFSWEHVGRFVVRRGREIIIDPLPGVDAQLLRLPLLGIVLSAVVQQRGMLALHASAVAIDGEGVAFLAPSGWGKSTLAAALYGKGHVYIADDMVVLDTTENAPPQIYPGIPFMKLFPESIVQSFQEDGMAQPRLIEGYEKRGRRAVTRVLQHPVALKSLYLLRVGVPN